MTSCLAWERPDWKSWKFALRYLYITKIFIDFSRKLFSRPTWRYIIPQSHYQWKRSLQKLISGMKYVLYVIPGHSLPLTQISFKFVYRCRCDWVIVKIILSRFKWNESYMLFQKIIYFSIKSYPKSFRCDWVIYIQISQHFNFHTQTSSLFVGSP